MNRISSANKYRGAFIYLFLLLVSFLVYFNALDNEFIFDDKFLIVDNAYIKDFRRIPKIFSTDIFHFQHPEDSSLGVYYRPLQALSYAIEYKLFGLKAAGYRLTNIAIHALNAFVLFLLVSRLFKDRLLALLSAVFFCLLPIHACLVSFIAGRSNLLETLFVFLSLAMFMSFAESGKKAHYALSLLCFMLALLCREGALLLPLFIAICAVFMGLDRKKTAACLMPFAVVGVLYAAWRLKFIPCDRLDLSALLSPGRLLAFAGMAQAYIEQLLMLVGFQSAFFAGNFISSLALSFIALAATAYFLVRALILKDRIAGFALLLYIAGLLPVMNLGDLIGYFGPALSEHYAYIASCGFAILIASLVLRLSLGSKVFAKTFFIALVCYYSALTVANNVNYKNDLVFYSHILSVDKRHNFIRNNLGNAFYLKGMYEQAAEQARQFLSREPNAWDAYLLLGNIHQAKGELSAAAGYYEKAAGLNPRASETYNNLALVYNKQGRNEEALENFRTAIRINPEAVWIRQNLADLLIRLERYGEALSVCEAILAMEPRDVGARVKAGVVMARLNLVPEAEQAFKEALKIDPKSVDAMKNLGSLYGNSGDFDRAIAFWQEALKYSPSDEKIMNDIKQAQLLKEGISK